MRLKRVEACTNGYNPLCEKYGFQLSEGQFIWEIKPPVELNKGTAALAVVNDYHLESVLFLGDDITDVHAMQALHERAADPDCDLSALSVGVIHPTTPQTIYEHCDVTANGVEDTTGLLQWINQNRTVPSDKSDQ